MAPAAWHIFVDSSFGFWEAFILVCQVKAEGDGCVEKLTSLLQTHSLSDDSAMSAGKLH